MHSLTSKQPLVPRHAPVNRLRRADGVVAHAVRARWLIDIRYGCKSDAQALLQEWQRDVGSQAGLSASNTRLSSGAIGVTETRLEMEVTFDSMDGWEDFLKRIPYESHKAWVQRISSMVVNDGTPRWEVYRIIPLLESPSSPSMVTSAKAKQPPPFPPPSPPALSPFTSNSGSGLLMIEDSAAADIVLDWKGDPMVINPKDKLPFKFL